MEDEVKNPDHINELKKRLDSTHGGMILHKKQGVLHDTHVPIKTDWDVKGDNVRKVTHLVEQTLSNNTMFKKFFIASIIFFVFAVLFSLYIFLGGNNTVSSKYIDINVVGSAYTPGGEELPLQIIINNKNPVSIELADLFIEYPKGTRGDSGGDSIRLLKPVGSIASGETTTVPLSLILYGEQGSVEEIKMRLEYRVGGSNAIFTKEKTYGVTISTAPLDLSIVAPTEATSNQQLVLKIKAVSNADRVAENTRLHVEYPPGFQFESSNPEPIYGNSVWDLGDLGQGGQREISITGTILGTDSEEKSFRIEGGSENTSDRSKIGVIYNSLIHTVLIKKPFVEAKVLVNGVSGDNFVASGTSPIQASISYANNLPVRVTDVEIRAKISGNAFNKNSITSPNGYYDSTSSEIVWSKNTDNGLAVLNPSNKGTLNFSVSPLSLVQSSGSFIRSPEIIIEVSISGKQPSEGNSIEEVKNTEKKIIKISTDFQVISKAIYSTGAFANSGPIPPKAGQETTYTVVWGLKNTANPVSGATVSAFLPIWVDFVGTIYPSSENLSYDASSRTVNWNIGTVDRGVGFGTNNREVSFQIKLKASTSQIGDSPVLVFAPLLSGVDSFTNGIISLKRPDLSTLIPNDPNYSSSASSIVTQ